MKILNQTTTRLAYDIACVECMYVNNDCKGKSSLSVQTEEIFILKRTHRIFSIKE